MPELAELRLTADYINHNSRGMKFVNILKNPVHKGLLLEQPFSSFSITAVSRGKELKLTLHDDNSNKSKNLLMTMGMSGHFSYSKTGNEPKHAHLKFNTNQGTTLSFVDVRRFGKWKWVEEWSVNRGPDPTLEYETFKENIKLNLSNRAFNYPIHEFLMNQKYCNGIGNYLRSEILYRLPHINPFISAREAFEQEPDLFELCRDIPLIAYMLGGGQLKDWENPFGGEDVKIKKFIRCYGNPSMKKIKDKNGRMFWYDPKWAYTN
jgi:endonuclease VIII-like 1